MRYIIAQCELPRYSKRGLNGSVPETATKSRKSFMKRDYFSCGRTTRRAFAHSLRPSFAFLFSREYSFSLSHTYIYTFLFLLHGFVPASNPGEPLSFRPLSFARTGSEIYSREDTSPERISHVPLESESTRLHPRSLHPAVLFLSSSFWGWFFVACKIPCFFFFFFSNARVKLRGWGFCIEERIFFSSLEYECLRLNVITWM